MWREVDQLRRLVDPVANLAEAFLILRWFSGLESSRWAT